MTSGKFSGMCVCVCISRSNCLLRSWMCVCVCVCVCVIDDYRCVIDDYRCVIDDIIDDRVYIVCVEGRSRMYCVFRGKIVYIYICV